MVYIEVWMIEEGGWANKLHRGSYYQSGVLQIVCFFWLNQENDYTGTNGHEI